VAERIAGGAYVPTFFAGVYAPLRRAHPKKQDVCPARRTMQRGAYITTKGVVTYAPAAKTADRAVKCGRGCRIA